MLKLVFNIVFFFLVFNHTVWSDNFYSYETKYQEVPLDHLAASPNTTTFKLRYLINLKFFKKGGPIFAYTGGNHDITNFAENNGFLFDAAPTFNAAILFIEHRYYGKSLPFGNSSFSINNIKHLTTSQALADFANVIITVKKQLVNKEDYASSHVFAFGGNYAGMLAAYLRMKYPFVAQGAITSSPGLLSFPKLSNCNGFYQRVTAVFEEYGKDACLKSVKLGWEVIINVSKSKVGLEFLTTHWKLCKKLSTDDVEKLIEWISNIYSDMAIVNYHSPSNYLAPVPAYPVKVFCEKLTSSSFNDSRSFIETFASALQIYTNYTGDKLCNNIYSSDSDFNEIAYQYQSCTELITPRCSTEEDMFMSKPWNLDKYLLNCYNRFEVRPVRSDWGLDTYGGKDLKYYTQLIITSNPKDPMAYETPDANNSLYDNDSVTFYNFTDASSMADLRRHSPADNNYIINTRNFYINTMKKWMNMN